MPAHSFARRLRPCHASQRRATESTWCASENAWRMDEDAFGPLSRVLTRARRPDHGGGVELAVAIVERLLLRGLSRPVILGAAGSVGSPRGRTRPPRIQLRLTVCRADTQHRPHTFVRVPRTSMPGADLNERLEVVVVDTPLDRTRRPLLRAIARRPRSRDLGPSGSAQRNAGAPRQASGESSPLSSTVDMAHRSSLRRSMRRGRPAPTRAGPFVRDPRGQQSAKGLAPCKRPWRGSCYVRRRDDIESGKGSLRKHSSWRSAASASGLPAGPEDWDPHEARSFGRGARRPDARLHQIMDEGASPPEPHAREDSTTSGWLHGRVRAKASGAGTPPASARSSGFRSSVADTGSRSRGVASPGMLFHEEASSSRLGRQA
jgi:hypothetical protein